MGYDSLDTTTDMLPTLQEVDEGGFYDVMSYYFDMNARWSMDKRIPSLGNSSTPLAEVSVPLPVSVSVSAAVDLSVCVCGCVCVCVWSMCLLLCVG